MDKQNKELIRTQAIDIYNGYCYCLMTPTLSKEERWEKEKDILFKNRYKLFFDTTGDDANELEYDCYMCKGDND